MRVDRFVMRPLIKTQSIINVIIDFVLPTIKLLFFVQKKCSTFTFDVKFLFCVLITLKYLVFESVSPEMRKYKRNAGIDDLIIIFTPFNFESTKYKEKGQHYNS